MSDWKDFEELIKNVFEKGGTPEYMVIPGIGEIYWPTMSTAERAFVSGYLEGMRYIRETNANN